MFGFPTQKGKPFANENILKSKVVASIKRTDSMSSANGAVKKKVKYFIIFFITNKI